MSFGPWLRGVLQEGASLLSEPLSLPAAEVAEVTQILQSEFHLHALDVGGAKMEFSPTFALKAAKLLAQACWVYVANAGSPESPLALALEPRGPADHLAVDLCFRFLPVVYRRAKMRSLESVLVRELNAILRRWPLSGVLADLEEGPLIEPAFQDHQGLQILYAERLVQFPRATWVPSAGKAREWVEFVFHEHQKSLPVMGRNEESPHA